MHLRRLVQALGRVAHGRREAPMVLGHGVEVVARGARQVHRRKGTDADTPEARAEPVPHAGRDEPRGPQDDDARAAFFTHGFERERVQWGA